MKLLHFMFSIVIIILQQFFGIICICLLNENLVLYVKHMVYIFKQFSVKNIKFLHRESYIKLFCVIPNLKQITSFDVRDLIPESSRSREHIHSFYDSINADGLILKTICWFMN